MGDVVELETTAKQARSGAPGELLEVLAAAEAGLASMSSASRTRGSRAQWAAVVSASQRVVNAACAVQDDAIASLAAIEPAELEDGTEVETHRAGGHVALDAAAIVSGVLAVSAVHAERRVRAAVRLAADGPTGTDTETGLGGLHDVMRRGDLDAYRAGVVAEELEEAPAQVAAAVVAALGDHLVTDAAPQLRRRCRTVLSRISPDLVRERAKRARERCALRRWAEEPGVDKWEGTFPSEDAARAWAAIDARAHQLGADGTCPRIDRARSQALIDLVTGSATIDTVVTLTVPAAAMDPGPADPALADRAYPGRSLDGHPGEPSSVVDADPTAATCDRSTAAHAASSTLGNPATFASGSPDDLIEVSMGTRGERMLVPRAFLDVVTKGVNARVIPRTCHRDTGALLDHTTSTSYRPTERVAALVRQRDGRCRFPGCHVNARFCDLDHVRPWPTGPTAARNLICLCRRHHRVKQRPGWRVLLHSDATLTWTDPTQRTRTTYPVNALATLVLAAAGPDPAKNSAGAATHDASTHSDSTADPAGPRCTDEFSAIEFTLEHALAGLTRADHVRRAELRHVPRAGTADHGSRLRIDLHRTPDPDSSRTPFVLAKAWERSSRHRADPHRRRDGHSREGDDPPF